MENLAAELKQLLVEHAPEMLGVINAPSQVSPQACWLDGDACPYGKPNGRFQDRPIMFCHLGESGCRRLDVFVADIDKFSSNYFENETEKRIAEAVEEESSSLALELSAIADEVSDPLAQRTLKLAGKIIEEDPDLNRRIIRVEDI